MISKRIAVFESTHETMRAESAFKEAGIKVRATIKPRTISSNCQMAITFAPETLDSIKNIIAGMRLKIIGFYQESADGDWREVDNDGAVK